MRKFLILSVCIALLGCSDPVRQAAGWSLLATGVAVGGVSGRQPFQPPPSGEERWHKVGATGDEVTKALLECGDVSPRATRFKGEPTMTQNESVLMRLCMEANGFTSDFEDSSKGFCKGWHSPPPACQPGTPTPARDVNMRLSSAFCHAYPKAHVCIP